MRARLEIRETGITIVHLGGRLDVESAAMFRDACLSSTSALLNQKVVFDFSQLSFVGSTGILTFLEAIQKFSNINVEGCKFSSVGSEFRKVFAATPLQTIGIYENSELAVLAYNSPEAAPLILAAEAAPLAASGVESEQNDDGVDEINAVPANGFGLLDFRSEPEEPTQAALDASIVAAPISTAERN